MKTAQYLRYTTRMSRGVIPAMMSRLENTRSFSFFFLVSIIIPRNITVLTAGLGLLHRRVDEHFDQPVVSTLQQGVSAEQKFAHWANTGRTVKQEGHSRYFCRCASYLLESFSKQRSVDLYAAAVPPRSGGKVKLSHTCNKVYCIKV